jgi:hypothetical protein
LVERLLGLKLGSLRVTSLYIQLPLLPFVLTLSLLLAQAREIFVLTLLLLLDPTFRLVFSACLVLLRHCLALLFEPSISLPSLLGYTLCLLSNFGGTLFLLLEKLLASRGVKNGVLWRHRGLGRNLSNAIGNGAKFLLEILLHAFCLFYFRLLDILFNLPLYFRF